MSRSFRIPAGSVWDNAWKMAAALALLGGTVAVAGAFMQADRFAFSYLFAFVTVLTLWLGSVFFCLIQHLTGAGWSVSVRRTSEFFVSGVVVLPFLFLPLLTQFDKLYPWWTHDDGGKAHAQDHVPANTPAADHDDRHVVHEVGDDDRGFSQAVHSGPHHADASDHGPHHLIEANTLAKKLPYLNHVFFFIRLFVYFSVWLWLGLTLFGKSVAQDRTGDKQLTVQLQRFATYGTFVFAFSLTFAGFDWIMSLEPGWYSTMFGVRIFAASAVTSFACVIVTALAFKRAGLVGDEINTEHFHDLGKLMFGFLVFWGYISFSEFFLIWYASIPEEVIYFHRRWDTTSWRTISIGIVVLKFIVPFWVTMSRNAKRNNAAIGFGAAWILALHLVEMYYWIMPYYRPFEAVQWGGIWLEAGCVMATLGAYLAVVLWRMTKHSLIAVGDPRLERALDFQNV